MLKRNQYSQRDLGRDRVRLQVLRHPFWVANGYAVGTVDFSHFLPNSEPQRTYVLRLNKMVIEYHRGAFNYH
jgi:hypothetical protein